MNINYTLFCAVGLLPNGKLHKLQWLSTLQYF